jgi:hypothetical protein
LTRLFVAEVLTATETKLDFVRHCETSWDAFFWCAVVMSSVEESSGRFAARPSFSRRPTVDLPVCGCCTNRDKTRLWSLRGPDMRTLITSASMAVVLSAASAHAQDCPRPLKEAQRLVLVTTASFR